MIPFVKRNKKPLVVRKPSEEKKAEHKVILEKVKLRRSSHAEAMKRENVIAKRTPEDRDNTKANTATQQFITFEEAVSFFCTQKKMKKGEAIRKAARDYPALHDRYVAQLNNSK